MGMENTDTSNTIPKNLVEHQEKYNILKKTLT